MAKKDPTQNPPRGGKGTAKGSGSKPSGSPPAGGKGSGSKGAGKGK